MALPKAGEWIKLYLKGETVEGVVTQIIGTMFIVKDADNVAWAGDHKSMWRKIT